LFVKTCFVDMGAHKNRSRMRPAPQGRASANSDHYLPYYNNGFERFAEAEETDKPRRKVKKLLAKEALASNEQGAKIPAAAKKS
jgi:hypothetical protein